ncbi:MAG: hypothetical protein KF883_03745 [Thermomicrobiales bacterium]|nr:hypothetical protein [Thermomicrobiales bacterium]
MSQAPVGAEKPLSVEVQGVGGSSAGATPGTLLVEEMTTGENPEILAVLATSYQSPPSQQQEQMAIDAVRSAVTSGSGQHLSEVMRRSFRDANRAIFNAAGHDEGEGVAMLALATRGKYATLALVGPDRGYLARAGRLNQVTRDQRVVVARSRRKQDTETASASATSTRLLGETDRLDSKSPAIFEIVLLPEDRLALLSRDLVDLVGESALLSGLQSGLPALVASAGSGSAAMAAVLSVLPAREALPVYQTAAGQQRPIWMIVIPVVLLLVVFALAAYFLL